MKTISVKVDEAIFNELNIRRGRASLSEYLRRIIEAHIEGQDKLLENLNKNEIRGLAIYLTEIIKLGNQPAYANQGEKIKSLFGQFLNILKED
jgi:predicted CopG family antitoxin